MNLFLKNVNVSFLKNRLCLKKENFMKKIIKVELILENCEAIAIPTFFIKTLSISNIDKKIQRIANNCIAEMDICDNFYIEIDSLFNEGKYLSFGMENKYFKSFFDRLEGFDDITRINLIYTDDSLYTIYPIWKDKNGPETNEYQHSYKNEQKKLIIKICSPSKLD